MADFDSLQSLTEGARAHLGNVADNLQLVADLAYGDVALVLALPDGGLQILADARPNTAVAPVPAVRVGLTLGHDAEHEAYETLASGRIVKGGMRRVARGIKYSTSAFPVGDPIVAIVVKHVAEQVTLAPGAMETAFMEAAEELLDSLRTGPLLDVRDGSRFSTTRRAGDGVMRVGATGTITYASPNAVNIMRLAGVEGALAGAQASTLPGGGFGIAPVLGTSAAIRVDTEVAERVLQYRSIGLPAGVLVLVEDLTEARRREVELKVKDATIREVHHRVKNNLQTIASLLRIQGRRTGSDEARRALAEATERVASMAVVHDLLAGSDDERIDFSQAAHTVVDLVRQGLLGADAMIEVPVSGSTGEIDAHLATSLALVLAELAHNAIEHGFEPGAKGRVEVTMRRVPGELVMTVRDNGRGMPEGFELNSSANLGLEIVRTVVEDDLRGTLGFSAGVGSTVTVRVPLED
ncbi:MAG: ATPase [Actinobacteria bacterium HGW-Actinobacteria-7]|nr:MAG: ATPase [Actinobacteria bacterium HGW-Actinobacteria-7]